jgi:hypothetical protein
VALYGVDALIDAKKVDLKVRLTSRQLEVIIPEAVLV